MKLITIESIIKPIKKVGLQKAKARHGNTLIEIDLGRLIVTYLDQEIGLEALPGSYGGTRYFFICPDCGKRRRKLYDTGLNVSCGSCLDINKITINRSKTDCVYYWELAFRECLKVDPKAKHVDGYYSWADFPSRPKYMKREKYFMHYLKFKKYMAKGDSLWL